MASTVVVSASGSVVIPAAIRRRLGMRAGSRVELVEEGAGLRLRVLRAATPSTIEEGFGMLVYDGPPVRLAAFDVARAMGSDVDR
jgi:antitoxin PrlF